MLFALKMAETNNHNDNYNAGHRQRLRTRLIESQGVGIQDYEILELILFGSHPRGDVKPLAKELIAKFNNLSGVLHASIYRLREVKGVSDAAIGAIATARIAAIRMLQEDVTEHEIFSTDSALVDYCRATMGFLTVEEFRVFFLDKKNKLISDEPLFKGTIDHTSVYPREVVKRALELHATALIIAHNHPSGDPKPSKADFDLTIQIQQALAVVGILLHDHIVVGKHKHYSFAANGKI
jgi:DNA repair protein RadC